ncbi:MAG: hypothetical protein JNK15_16325 [Planctomycetes bacterium]|nr:hypothetical protein [Planctomycetota bacterium]
MLPAGTVLDLRRIGPDGADVPTFALLIVVPATPWQPSQIERSRVDADRLDGSALRRDHRDSDGGTA